MLLALACGQSTHVWTALHALEHLAPDGALAALLAPPEARDGLISGAMFPDGGYSPTVAHPYGEVAHWEPFHLAFLERIRDPGDPAEVGFLLGMAAHGIGDQLFDAAYLTRSRVHDAWDAQGGAQSSADTDTDVVMASLVGPRPPHDHRVPYDALVEVFAAQGVAVDADTMARGMGALDLAVAWVGATSALPDQVAAAEARYPWATSHLLDPDTPGAPPCLGEAIAAYWGVLLDRLDGRPTSGRLLGSWPPDRARVPPRAAGDVDGLVSLLLGAATTAQALSVEVTDDRGDAVPVEAWLYYGDGSNVVDVSPLEGWAADRVFTVAVRTDGLDATTTFTTREAPEGTPARPRGCATGPGAAAGLAPLVALGLARRRRYSG